MGVNDKQVAQSQFQNNQDFDLDINEMYQDFVVGTSDNKDNVAIDDMRSQININATQPQLSKMLLDSILASSVNNSTSQQANPSTGTNNTTTPTQQLVAESRCHTFYRIIGFPVVANDFKFYNPGFDSIRTISLTDKVSIAEDPIDGFEALSNARETYVNNNNKIFSNPTSINAGVYSLTSGTYNSNGTVNKRVFNSSFLKSTDAFDTVITNQNYKLGFISLVGNQEILLQEFEDINGSSADNSIFNYHLHIIKPFIVDPRIDFSVYPIDSGTKANVSKKVAVPFVPDQTFLKISANAFAQRPLLEKILRERFSQDNQITNSGTSTQNILDFVSSFTAIKNETLVQTISSGDLYNLSQQSAFAQFLNMAQAMMKKLVEAMNMVHQQQGLYYWLPQPSTSGPEGDFTVRPVFVSSQVSNSLYTQNDFNIILKVAQAAVNNLSVSNAQSNSVPDVGGFAFSGFSLTFAPDTSDSTGSNSSQSLDKMNTTRDQSLTKAGNSLQVIEMIMGEFSGLGLCDIIVILASLYIMPQNLLLEFLDSASLNRMQIALNDPNGNVIKKDISDDTTPGIKIAMQSLTDTANNLYQIMEQIFQDTFNNNGLNSN